MKLCLSCLLVATAAWSQTPAAAPVQSAKPPVKASPGTPAPGAVKPDVKPNTVVMSVKGQPVTAGEIQAMVDGFPPQVRQQYASNPREIARQFMVFKYIAALAEKAKLDQESPYKEQIAFLRTQTLWQAEINRVTLELDRVDEAEEKYYADNKDKYTQAKVKAIYIPYSSAPVSATDGAKKPLTEAEAKAKADDVVKQLKGGADFVKLVKEVSEDPSSTQSNGDLPPMKKSDSIPEPLKSAIFAMKAGEISAPVKHTNGYYIFKAEEIGTQTYDQVKDQIRQELKNDRIRQWLAQTEKEAEVKVENEAYFTPQTPPQAPAQPQPKRP